MEVPYQDRIRNDSPDCERSFDPQSVVEGKVVDDPMLVPDVCEVGVCEIGEKVFCDWLNLVPVHFDTEPVR